MPVTTVISGLPYWITMRLFEAFKENGIFDQKTAESFRKNILEKNGIEDPMTMYTNFRGREPNIEPLLKNRGLMN